MGLRMRVWLITGAGGTLGTALLSAVTSLGCQAVAVYHRQNKQRDNFVDASATCQASSPRRTNVTDLYADLSSEADIQRIAERCKELYESIDVVVNCAYHKQFGRLLNNPQHIGSIHRQFSVNVASPLLLAVAIANAFWLDDIDGNITKGRHIVNVSSTSGVNCYRNRGQAIYAASKAALNMLSQHMAFEFQSIGVRINCVVPTSFPALVPTSRVVREILRFDQTDETGAQITIE